MDINKFSVKNRLSSKHLLTISNFDEADIFEVLHLARQIKAKQKMKEKLNNFADKTVAFLISSSNSRMRIAFELAVKQLGGNTLYLSPNDVDFSNGLTYIDAIEVLKRYGVSGLVFKTDNSTDFNELYKNSSLPIINVLDNWNNPCQFLTNIFTIWEKKGKLVGNTLTFVGNCKDLHADTLNAYGKCGITIKLACPNAYSLSETNLNNASQYGDIVVVDDLKTALINADFVSSRFLCKSGDPQYDELKDFTISKEVMDLAKPDAKFMHILPVEHNDEVADDVLYGEKSIVFDQAENLIYVQKALMLLLFK